MINFRTNLFLVICLFSVSYGHAAALDYGMDFTYHDPDSVAPTDNCSNATDWVGNGYPSCGDSNSAPNQANDIVTENYEVVPLKIGDQITCKIQVNGKALLKFDLGLRGKSIWFFEGDPSLCSKYKETVEEYLDPKGRLFVGFHRMLIKSYLSRYDANERCVSVIALPRLGSLEPNLALVRTVEGATAEASCREGRL